MSAPTFDTRGLDLEPGPTICLIVVSLHRCSNSKTGFGKRERERVTLFTRGVEPGANNTQFLALVARKERPRFPRRGVSNTGQDRLAPSNRDYHKVTQIITKENKHRHGYKVTQTVSNTGQDRLWHEETLIIKKEHKHRLWHKL